MSFCREYDEIHTSGTVTQKEIDQKECEQTIVAHMIATPSGETTGIMAELGSTITSLRKAGRAPRNPLTDLAYDNYAESVKVKADPVALAKLMGDFPVREENYYGLVRPLEEKKKRLEAGLLASIGHFAIIGEKQFLLSSWNQKDIVKGLISAIKAEMEEL
jgi:hypothetical protein